MKRSRLDVDPESVVTGANITLRARHALLYVPVHPHIYAASGEV